MKLFIKTGYEAVYWNKLKYSSTAYFQTHILIHTVFGQCNFSL